MLFKLQKEKVVTPPTEDVFATKIEHFNGEGDKEEGPTTSETNVEQGGGDATATPAETAQESAQPMESWFGNLLWSW